MIFPPPPPPPPQATQNQGFGSNRGSPHNFRGRGGPSQRAYRPYRRGNFSRGDHGYGQARGHSANNNYDPNSLNSSGSILGGNNHSTFNPNKTRGYERIGQSFPPVQSNYNPFNQNSSNSQLQNNQWDHRQGYPPSGRDVRNGRQDPTPTSVNGIPTNQNFHSPGQKRSHRDAFGRTNQHAAKGQAPPSVPMFGGALPQPPKPPVAQIPPKKKEKEPSKHNLLGLTPALDAYESSESENGDEDEEAKLALKSSGPISSQSLQIVHKGKVFTLRTPADFAAWIAERKKNFPTRAKAAEALIRKQKQADALRASQSSSSGRHNKPHSQPKGRDGRKTNQKNNDQCSEKLKNDDAATESKRRIQELRDQLKREEKRAAELQGKPTKLIEKKAPRIQPTKHAIAPKASADANPMIDDSSDAGKSNSSSYLSSSATDDMTSSSGSSDTEDKSSEGELLERNPTTGNSLEKPTPERTKSQGLCRQFLKSGRCIRGKSCRYHHELPTKGKNRALTEQKAKGGGKRGRVSLYQRLVEKEQLEEDRNIVRAILDLGDKGLLKPTSNGKRGNRRKAKDAGITS